MSRDFILIFSGGMVSLITTLVVLFVADYIYRRGQIMQAQPPKAESTPLMGTTPPASERPVESKSEPMHPPEPKMAQTQKDSTS